MATKKKPADEAEETTASAAKKPAEPPSIFDIVSSTMKAQKINNIQLKETKSTDLLSTGILCLDLLMGGGHKAGRVTQIYGAAHSGKSTTAYTALAAILNLPKPVLTSMYDYEGTTDRAYITKLGVDLDKAGKFFMYSRVTDGPTMYKFIRNATKQMPDWVEGAPQFVLFCDSIAQMATAGEMEDEEEDARAARRAVMHSAWWPRIKTLLSVKGVSILAINQIRANISPYAPPQTRPGGNAWEFCTDNLIKVKGGKKEMFEGEEYQPITFLTEKNKNAVSGFEATIFLKLGHGFDPASDLIEFLNLTGLGHKEKIGGKFHFVVDERFTKLSGSTVELHGAVPYMKFERDIREDAEFRAHFFTAAFKILREGLAFPLMQRARIDESKAKAKKDAEKKAKGEAPDAPSSKKDKKGMKKVKAEVVEEEDDDDAIIDTNPPEFTFDKVVDLGDDDDDDVVEAA